MSGLVNHSGFEGRVVPDKHGVHVIKALALVCTRIAFLAPTPLYIGGNPIIQIENPFFCLPLRDSVGSHTLFTLRDRV